VTRLKYPLSAMGRGPEGQSLSRACCPSRSDALCGGVRLLTSRTLWAFPAREDARPTLATRPYVGSYELEMKIKFDGNQDSNWTPSARWWTCLPGNRSRGRRCNGRATRSAASCCGNGGGQFACVEPRGHSGATSGRFRRTTGSNRRPICRVELFGRDGDGHGQDLRYLRTCSS